MSFALMAGLFDGAWLKWARGVVHAQALDNEIGVHMRDLQANQPFSTRTEYGANYRCVRLIIDEIDPWPQRFELLVGDTASNFRMALDHIAWAIVTTRPKRPLRPGEDERIYFPLATSPEKFREHFFVKNFLPRADRAIIRRYQPYANGRRSIPIHCLTSLPVLNREDKHRVVQPVWTWPTKGTFYAGAPVDCEISRIPTRAKGIVLQPGAEIQRVYVRRTGPNPNLDMKVELSVTCSRSW